MPRVFVLIPSTSYRAKAFLHAGTSASIDITVASDRRNTLASFNPAGLIDLPYDDAKEAIRLVREFASHHLLDGVIGVDDEGVVLAHQIAAALQLRHNPVKSVAATRNKFAMRTFLHQAGVSQPDFYMIESGNRREAPAFGFPCVVKPLSLSGSRGVIRVDNEAEFAYACERVIGIVQKERQSCVQECVLTESFIDGEEVALEGVLAEGELHVFALFDKPDPLDGPFFEETIYVTPSRHSQKRQSEIIACVKDGVAALGLRRGPVHAEVRFNDSGVFLIEIAARSIGGFCSKILRFSDGQKEVSLEELLLRDAIGEDVRSFSRERSAAGVMMLPIREAGILSSVSGVEVAREVKGVEEIIISVHSGKEMIPLPEGGTYPGFIFSRAETPQEVETALRSANKHIIFETEEITTEA